MVRSEWQSGCDADATSDQDKTIGLQDARHRIVWVWAIEQRDEVLIVIKCLGRTVDLRT
jgi:hypothetical protein